MTTDEHMKAVARAAQEEQDEAVRMLAPLDAKARARISDRILAQMQQEKAAEASGEGAKVIPLSTKRQRWAPVLAALAVAAALALLIGRRSAPIEVALGPSSAPLPGYSMELAEGERRVRGDEPLAKEAFITLGSGSSFEVLLRPSAPDGKPIAVRSFLIQDGHARLWQVEPDISSDGAVRIQGKRDTLFTNVPAGPWEIVIAVARPGDLPDADAVAHDAVRMGERVRLFRARVLLVDGVTPR
jgi:hypothetical protein